MGFDFGGVRLAEPRLPGASICQASQRAGSAVMREKWYPTIMN
jgi:hypothetical protein